MRMRWRLALLGDPPTTGASRTYGHELGRLEFPVIDAIAVEPPHEMPDAEVHSRRQLKSVPEAVRGLLGFLAFFRGAVFAEIGDAHSTSGVGAMHRLFSLPVLCFGSVFLDTSSLSSFFLHSRPFAVVFSRIVVTAKHHDVSSNHGQSTRNDWKTSKPFGVEDRRTTKNSVAL